MVTHRCREMFHFLSKLQIFQIKQVCRNKQLSFNRLFCIFCKIHVVFLAFSFKNCRKLGPTSCFGFYILNLLYLRLRYKWPFGISATVSYSSSRRGNFTVTPTGNYDPSCLPVRVLFLLQFFSLPLLALAKASHPTKI